MRKKLTPVLVEVDPQLIKFNVNNPRKHRGSEYYRLKKSVIDVGMVQMPTVRVLPGGFYECIDGEGRVRIAQETHLPAIWVVSFDLVDGPEALTMLQAANTIRHFNFLAECQGLASLHYQGASISTLSEKFGVDPTALTRMVDIGSFPDALITMIQEDMAQSEEKKRRWTFSLLYELLPLRQENPQYQALVSEERPTASFAVQYDYTEVREAIQQVVRGDIETAPQMARYVAQRRLELYQSRFDQKLHQRVEAEIIRAKQALEQSYQQKIQEGQKEIIQCYEKQIISLQQQLNDMEKRHQAIIKDVAKRPQIVKQREEELQKQIQATKQKRLDLQAFQQQLEKEAQERQECMQKEIEKQIFQRETQQKENLKQEYKAIKSDLEAHYAEKDRERQMRTEQTIHQMVAHTTKLLAESQQLMLQVMSPDILKEVIQLHDLEIMNFLAQMRIVRETLEKAEEKLLHGPIVSPFETERRCSDGIATECP